MAIIIDPYPLIGRRLCLLLAVVLSGIFFPGGASAQEPPCPTDPVEWQRRCQSAEADASRLGADIHSLESVMTNPDIVLITADRLPNESPVDYEARVKRNRGIRSPVTSTWLPIIGHYFIPDSGTALVAMDRTDYWRYIGEAFGFDSREAVSVFKSQETAGHHIRLSRFLGPQGRIAGLKREKDRIQGFVERCCITPPEIPSLDVIDAPLLPQGKVTGSGDPLAAPRPPTASVP